MAQHMTTEALSVAAFAKYLAHLPHETWAVVTATENGTPWAHVQIVPTTDTARAVFPVYADGMRGDTSKRGQSGVMVRGDSSHELRVVIERARRMANI